MKRVVLLLLLILFFSTLRSQVDIESSNAILGGYFRTNGLWSGALLQLNSSGLDNWMRFIEDGTTEHGRIGFSSAAGYGNLLIRNSNTGFGDLIILRGGNGGQFWMYPDGKLYANNIGDIGSHRDMHWNQTTGEIGWTSSSARFKTNIRLMTDDWTKILQVQPVTYTRPESPDRWEYGYIAEQLDSIGLQSLVGYGTDGLPEYIDYEKMVLYLTEIVKSQQEAIARLEKVIQEITRTIRTGKGRKSTRRHKKH